MYWFTIVLPVVLGQIQPDVQFDDGNDRFDLTPLVRQGAFDQWGDFVASERRAGGSNEKQGFKIDTRSLLDTLRRRQDNLWETEHGYQRLEDQYRKTNGRKDLISYLHGKPGASRRSAALVDKEVLMHHAVPVKMRIEGVLVPQDDE